MQACCALKFCCRVFLTVLNSTLACQTFDVILFGYLSVVLVPAGLHSELCSNHLMIRVAVCSWFTYSIHNTAHPFLLNCCVVDLVSVRAIWGMCIFFVGDGYRKC